MSLSGTVTLTDHVLTSRAGGVGRIQLNRPHALNSLTLDMIRSMAAALADFAADREVTVVVVDGLGDRGLCAGGDIRAIYESGKRGDGAAATFLREEYSLNAYIARYPKPYVAFMDGITMGGGVGISAHGTHRLVTERTRLAMPETGIGFIPDVGATWLLPRAPGEIGTYLGLTGTGIGGADAIYARLADTLVPSAALPAIVAALAALGPGACREDVAAVLRRFALPVAAPLAAQRALIDRTMSFDSVPQIVAALEADGSEFALATARIIREKSPTSLVLTLHMLRLGRATPSLRGCLDREYFAALRIMKGADLYEGVRAAVIDKDRKPRWTPATLATVDAAALLRDALPS